MESAPYQFKIETKLQQSKEEVMEVKDFGGIPEDTPGELQIGTDMIFSFDAKAEKDEKKDDPMWSSSSDMPSDWLFGDECS